MRKFQPRFIGTFATLLLGFCQMATAQSQGAYVEGALGYGKYLANSDQFSSSDLGDVAWAVRAGYMLNEYFGLEGGYRSLGSYSISGLQTPTTTKVPGLRQPFYSTGTFSIKTKTDGWLAGIRANYPIDDKFSAQFRTGLYTWKATSDISTTTALLIPPTLVIPSASSGSVSEDGTNIYWGVGGQYKISKQFGIGIGFAQFKVGDEKHNSFDATFIYSF